MADLYRCEACNRPTMLTGPLTTAKVVCEEGEKVEVQPRKLCDACRKALRV